MTEEQGATLAQEIGYCFRKIVINRDHDMRVQAIIEQLSMTVFDEATDIELTLLDLPLSQGNIDLADFMTEMYNQNFQKWSEEKEDRRQLSLFEKDKNELPQ